MPQALQDQPDFLASLIETHAQENMPLRGVFCYMLFTLIERSHLLGLSAGALVLSPLDVLCQR
jgi:hypothetical protein